MKRTVLAILLVGMTATAIADIIDAGTWVQRGEKNGLVLTVQEMGRARKLTYRLLGPDGKPQANAYGNYALGYGGQLHTDLEQPNPAFFHHVDWVVKRASAKGLQVKLFAPGVSSGFSSEKRTAFVLYLRKRYERNRRVQVTERESSP